jgi:hypothetical protein
MWKWEIWIPKKGLNPKKEEDFQKSKKSRSPRNGLDSSRQSQCSAITTPTLLEGRTSIVYPIYISSGSLDFCTSGPLCVVSEAMCQTLDSNQIGGWIVHHWARRTDSAALDRWAATATPQRCTLGTYDAVCLSVTKCLTNQRQAFTFCHFL